MSHTATAFVRFGTGKKAPWGGADLDVDDVDDVDALVDALDSVIDQAALLTGESTQDADTVLVLVEEDDEWFGVLRVHDGDVRMFLSDRRAVLTSELAERFFSEAVGTDAADDEAVEDDEAGDPPVPDDIEIPSVESELPEIEPGGDSDLLKDLGTPSAALLRLCQVEGALPSDVIATLAESAGAGVVLEELRGG